MSEDTMKETAGRIEGREEELAEDEELTPALPDKLSIQQILEGMTNEFNRAVAKCNDDEKNTEKIGNADGETNEGSTSLENGEMLEDSVLEGTEEASESPEEVISDPKEPLRDGNEVGRQEAPKKDGNVPRIVLTFRTIDENTNDGKKTKISSCGPSLSLVTEELVHSDQIGGVSVKIEHSDEVSEGVDKSDNEEGRDGDEVKSVGMGEAEGKDGVVAGEGDEGGKGDGEEVKVAPATRKRKYASRQKAVSTDSPCPKRSARRSCKEQFSVLESAMARKEKSYYTGDSKVTKKAVKASGRSKRLSGAKDRGRGDANASLELGSSVNEGNSSLEEAREASPGDAGEERARGAGEFEGMPKLSPMVKEMEKLAKGEPGKSDKPFLRPVVGKNRRDRGRARSAAAGRRMVKVEGFEDGSEAAEAGKNNDYPEESNVPTKRTRRSMAPSPSPAEGQASKPESTAILSETYEQSMLCLCQVRSQLYVTITGSGAPLYCTAIDSIDNRLIGCCNEVDSNDVAMRRPSTRVPFIILCRAHKERLLRHNCCPSCGLFCTQGKFTQCNNGHQYHIDCEVFVNKKPVCPHCANDSSNIHVLVTMSGSRKPVYIPSRKKFSKLPSAKMSLPGKGDNTKLAERPPSPLVSPGDIKIPEPTVTSERPERYTVMSLYQAVKNGDLEKLVNVLSCGYNANHTFREHSQRTGLHIAAERGHLGCVNILVQAGAQLDVMDKNQLTPLMLAATEGKTEIVRYLVRVGADVTLKGEDGMTALHRAAKSGHLEACQIILSECKVPKTLVDSVDDGGWTSLIWACEFCHIDVARFLIEKKCDPLIRDAEQNIALHWSAFSGSSEITEMLLNEGCDVNAVNVHGDTPLHIAARQDQYAVSVLLLARGAKVSEVNAAGETAVNCCTTDGDTLAALRLNARVNELSEHMWEKTTRILTNDISRGKETNPIQCVNGFDAEDKPTDFIYVTENCFTSNIHVDRTITSLQSCRCEDNCSSEKCLCGNISLRCWYDEEGKLIPEFNYADPPMLFECNQACDCNRITCNNRVVQHGLTQRFQLFRTKGKGWGLKTLRPIPKGAYVCEYIGEIISDSEADHREDDSYLFDLDNRDGETYCIDARRYGNLARFINHSCAPNLLPVRVFVEHQDLHFPRIAFFANRDIAADEELGFDYGEKFWIIKYKSFTCTCGALNCRYSEKTIQVTLDNYRKKMQQEESLAAQIV
ncbi:histone-lysine N-methyltransferase EHMT1 [Diachasma alloeum]|uniref:histone-lysine N-methyltransferase EHMT1 n=1 Tax=Diachasma alloeum TaxID=454923 RepID=UPI0007383C8C|nr:histone-lysine N-methyltransferase EHMT1 [Diachasma alloeum]